MLIVRTKGTFNTDKGKSRGITSWDMFRRKGHHNMEGKNARSKLMVAVSVKDGLVIVGDVHVTTCSVRHVTGFRKT